MRVVVWPMAAPNENLPTTPRIAREEHCVAIDQALLVSLGMSPDQADRWIVETAALRRSCGCTTGAGFMVAALLLCPPVWYWMLREHFQPPWLAILAGLVVTFVAGGIGKLTGLLTARVRLGARLRDIQIRVTEGTPSGNGVYPDYFEVDSVRVYRPMKAGRRPAGGRATGQEPV